MSAPCGCNGAAGAAGPAIPPGQSSFPYRGGTYATFFAAMMQRLSSSPCPALSGPDGLKTRATGDVGPGVQNVRPPGNLPQTFETAEPVEASDAWNTLPPRLVRPQIIAAATTVAYAEGMSTNLKKNDPVLIVTSAADPAVF